MLPIRSHLAAALAVAGVLVAGPAFAQASSCGDAQKFLSERQNLIQEINKLSGGGKKKAIDPRAACGIFTKLVANGNTGLKWLESNKTWCQVPDQFAEGFEADHKRAVEMKGKACAAAAKVAEMEKQAKKAQQQGGGLLGGGGLTGSYTMPKGAL
ncbi:hypothetical protein [Microvirga thermotolerans]|uniref:Uncharacterized protein n=1 Tax=Microvirga thermotolerans TaxID=2651334 RepID=A0A5P9JUE7_9HYPH|nr:hypothetical protein [Microvirga thermotolerans]QFU15741.1 hypothetical protein GDR74_05630 [Microvirga thermotolerans]